MSASLPVLAIALALSGLGLLGGPLILSLGRGRALTGAVVEGLTLGLVPTMVLLRLLPHVTDQLGIVAVLLTIGSFLALRGFDRAHHRAAARVGRAFIYTALLFHSFTDGLGLAAAVAASGPRTVDLTLTLAFVVHRLPEGLFIATTLLPSYGMRRTLVRIGGLFVATLAGGLLGGVLMPHLSERLFDAVVAIGLGAMLQIVVHSHAERADGATTRALSSLALVAGVAAALLVPAPRDLLREARPHELTIVESFLPLATEIAPFWLLGLVLGAIAQVLPAPAMPTAERRSIGRSIVLGVRLSAGPAGVLAGARGLFAMGASLADVVAFAIAASLCNLGGVLVSARLFGIAWTAIYLGAALLLALAGGALARDRAAAQIADVPRSASPAGGAHQTWTQLFAAIDHEGPWVLAGIAVASALEAALPAGALTGSLSLAAVFLVIALATIVRAPLLSLLPVAAVLAHKGISPGAAIAVVALPPLVSVLALVGEKDRRSAMMLALVPVSAAIAAVFVPLPATWLPSLHAALARTPALYDRAAAIVMAIAIAFSLARLGPRLWLGQLGLFAEPPHHHEHEPEHQHDHAHQ